MSVLTISTEDDFTNHVINAEQPVLVDFWAPWCNPCKMVAPEVEAVAETYHDKALVAKVNVDELKKIAAQHNIMSIPTLLIFKDGQELKRIVGYHPRKELGSAIEAAL